MSLTSPSPIDQSSIPQDPPSPSPSGIPTQISLPDLPAPRKTSSPLSSPSSSRGHNLPGINDDELITNEARSPATSSTLPLTDEEDEGGDEDSELTEEEEEEEVEEVPRVDEEEDQEGVNGNIGKIRQPIFPTSRSNREGSQASTASLTPPPSDKSILSSPQLSPKITLKLNPPKMEEEEENVDVQDEDAEGEEDDEEEEDGDVTMRADPPVEEDEDKLGIDRDTKEGIISEIISERERENDQDHIESAEVEIAEPIQDSTGDTSAVEEEEEEEKELGDKIVIDEDEVDVEPPVEIEVEVEEPPQTEQEELEGENDQTVEQDEEEVEQEENDDNEPETADSPAYLTVPMHGKAAHSTHAPPPTSAAMRSLVMLELKFAALRDRLYIERMEEAAAEEDMILNGTHPALKYLYKTLSDRRERLHEVASRRHQQTLGELKRVREAEQHLIWSSWTEDRDRLHWNEFEQTWSKRRRLAREKNEIETPRIVKPVPKVGQPSTIRAFDWSAGATPSQLSREEGSNDLAIMEQQNRRQYQTARNGSPSMFASQYNVAGSSSQPVNGGQTIYSYPQTQQTQEAPQPRHNTIAQNQQQSQPIPQQQPQAQTQNPINAHSNYPPRIATTSNQKPYQPPQPPLPSQPQAQIQPQSQTHLQHVQRREGRTVPTTSDFFTGGPRRDSPSSSITGLAQKIKSPEEEPLSPIGLWSRGINGNQPKKDGSSPRTPSSLGTPTLPNNPPPSNQSLLGLTQNPTPYTSSNGVIPGRPNSAGTSSGINSSLKSPPSINDIRGIGNGPIRSNSAGSTQPQYTNSNGTNNLNQQPPRSNSNPTSSTTTPNQNQNRDGNGQQHNNNPRPDPKRFAELADYLAGSTAPPGTGLFGMGIGMGMGLGGLGAMGGMGGMGGMGLGVPMGMGKGIGNVGQNNRRSPFQNGNASPASNTPTTGLGGNNHNHNNINNNKPTSPIPPPPPSGTVTTAGTNEARS